MSITQVPIRATVTAGGVSVSTPYVLSFNATHNRGRPATATASLKVQGGSNVSGGSSFVISAGLENASNTVFTGIVKKASISPCFDDPSFYILNISGEDALSLLEGKKYTRRCRSTNAAWVSIEGVSRRGLKDGKFAYRKGEEVFELTHGGLDTASPNVKTRTGTPVESKALTTPDRGGDLKGGVQIQPSFEGQPAGSGL